MGDRSCRYTRICSSWISSNQTSHIENDVWSYGVFLYELITGRCAVDRNRPRGEQNLLEWIRPCLALDRNKFQLILDPRLDNKKQIAKSAQ
ncbi:hypothetical protein Lal_00032853 [Lupinus albus]|nr:hypothetical protein Lal_00032853 [Lupinus albus]